MGCGKHKKGIADVINGAMGILLASETYGVPFATLQRAARSDSQQYFSRNIKVLDKAR